MSASSAAALEPLELAGDARSALRICRLVLGFMSISWRLPDHEERIESLLKLPGVSAGLSALVGGNSHRDGSSSDAIPIRSWIGRVLTTFHGMSHEYGAYLAADKLFTHSSHFRRSVIASLSLGDSVRDIPTDQLVLLTVAAIRLRHVDRPCELAHNMLLSCKSTPGLTDNLVMIAAAVVNDRAERDFFDSGDNSNRLAMGDAVNVGAPARRAAAAAAGLPRAASSHSVTASVTTSGGGSLGGQFLQAGTSGSPVITLQDLLECAQFLANASQINGLAHEAWWRRRAAVLGRVAALNEP